MLLNKFYRISKYKQMISFPLYISFNGRSIASFQRGEGGGAVRSIYAGNVVIPMIIFFCSFHNDTGVVWISKTVSVDATYLQQLIRNSLFILMKAEGLVYDLPREVNFFLENRCKKIHGEKSGIYQNYYFLCLIPIWQSLSFGVNIFPLNKRSPTFRTIILFLFIDCKCNKRKVNKHYFFSP